MNQRIYVPKIDAADIDFDDLGDMRALQASISELELDHFKHKDGRVFRILGTLNKKSVPVNAANPADPQRVNFSSVVSFGCMSPAGENTEYADAVAEGDLERAALIAAENQARGDEIKARFKGGKADTDVDTEVDIDVDTMDDTKPTKPQADAENPVGDPSATHSERAHALLSASGAHRWLNCTPSALLEDAEPEDSSDAADEGTAAHALGEHKIKRALRLRSDRPTSEYEDDAMGDYTDAYRDFVLERWEMSKQHDPSAVISLEQRLDFSHWVPDGFGTGDCVIVAGNHLTIIDFKYGAGVLVDGWDNPQMKLYALGALQAYSWMFDIHTVDMIIYQPRRDNISQYTLTVDDLLTWANETVKPTADIAAKGEGEFAPGAWCQFCKLKYTCRARAEQNLEIAQWEFEPPTELTEEELVRAYKLLEPARAWFNDLEKYMSEQAIDKGKAWPGLKIVAGRATRAYTDADKVAEAAKKAGFTDIFDRKLLTLTRMEKLMGKKTFTEVLGDLVVNKEGKPKLVPDSDRRAAISSRSAADEFGDVAGDA